VPEIKGFVAHCSATLDSLRCFATTLIRGIRRIEPSPNSSDCKQACIVRFVLVSAWLIANARHQYYRLHMARSLHLDVRLLTCYREQAKVSSVRTREYIQTGILPYFSGFSLDLFPRTDAFLLFIKTYPVHMKTCKRPFYQHFSIS